MIGISDKKSNILREAIIGEFLILFKSNGIGFSVQVAVFNNNAPVPDTRHLTPKSIAFKIRHI